MGALQLQRDAKLTESVKTFPAEQVHKQLAPGSVVLKLFTAVIYKYPY
jgi:hypothetical protein